MSKYDWIAAAKAHGGKYRRSWVDGEHYIDNGCDFLAGSYTSPEHAAEKYCRHYGLVFEARVLGALNEGTLSVLGNPDHDTTCDLPEDTAALPPG